MLKKQNVEEVIIEPLYDDNFIVDETIKDSYALLAPKDFAKMTDSDIKEWYKKNKNK